MENRPSTIRPILYLIKPFQQSSSRRPPQTKQKKHETKVFSFLHCFVKITERLEAFLSREYRNIEASLSREFYCLSVSNYSFLTSDWEKAIFRSRHGRKL